MIPVRPSEEYPIEQYIMTKNDCYKANKRRKPTGIQVHSVGCKGTTRDRWRKWNNSGIKKCANAIIDTNGIMQTLDWDVRPWLSGSGSKGNANDWCVGFEICEPSVAKDTPEAAAYLYGCVLYLCTELCRDYGIDPSEIKCHCELHREGCASNHADVNHWWGKKGTSWEPYTMVRLRKDVAENLGIKKEVKTLTGVLRRGSQGDEVAALQEMLNAVGLDCGAADGIYGKKTMAAVKAFQEAYGLSVDGLCGPLTWNKLMSIQPANIEPEPEPEPQDDNTNEDIPFDDTMIFIEQEELIDLLNEMESIKAKLDEQIYKVKVWLGVDE